MKILNLYAGIGGNRIAWGDSHEVTAVELDPDIAKIYQDTFPQDKVVISDAHQFLEDNFQDFDFIWSSPPCPTHSRVRFATQQQNKPIYVDMKLYQEILFLQSYFKGLWVVENVISYYKPLIAPQTMMGHFIWSNVMLPPLPLTTRGHMKSAQETAKIKGLDFSKIKNVDKTKVVRNAVDSALSAHIFNHVINPWQPQPQMF